MRNPPPTDINTEMTTPSATYPPAEAPPRAAAVVAEPARSTGSWIVLAIVVILLVAGIIWGILARSANERQLAQSTHTSSELTVNVTSLGVRGSEAEILVQIESYYLGEIE